MPPRDALRKSQSFESGSGGRIGRESPLYEGKIICSCFRERDSRAGETLAELVSQFIFFLFMLSVPIEAFTLFTSYSHPAFVLPACGFRVEIESLPHKKKAELYFALLVKKILTQNRVWHWRLLHS